MEKNDSEFKQYTSISDLFQKNIVGDYHDQVFTKVIIGEKQQESNVNSNYSDELSGTFTHKAIFFENAIFNCTLNIRDFKSGCVLSFINCEFPYGITIGDKIEMKDSIQFIDCKILPSLSIDNYNNINDIEISKCSIGRLELIASLNKEIKFHELKINNSSTIKELIVSTENNFEGNLSIMNSTLNRIHVKGGLGKLELNSSYNIISELILENLSENIKVNFMNSRFTSGVSKSLFMIKLSDLSKCKFYNIEFNKVDTILISDSNLNNTLFVNVRWSNSINEYSGRRLTISDINNIPLNLEISSFKRIEIECNNLSRKEKIHYEEVNQVYKQLKFSFSKTGDKVQERYFHALEMRNFDKSLDWFSSSFFTKLVLRFSYCFSDFGQSVFRPLCALIIVCWLFLLFLISKGYYENLKITYLLNTDWNAFKNGLLEFAKLVNPIRKPLEISEGEKEVTELVAVLDLLFKVFSSYMIYNFIRATRSYIN